jgi:hypothetical protein
VDAGGWSGALARGKRRLGTKTGSLSFRIPFFLNILVISSQLYLRFGRNSALVYIPIAISQK